MTYKKCVYCAQFVKRATGKFTLTFVVLVTGCFTLKSQKYGTQKLSYDEESDRKIAVAAYIRKNYDSIKFLGEKVKGKKVKNAEAEVGSCKPISDEKVYWRCLGDVSLSILVGDDDCLAETYHFSCDCKLKRGEQGEPVVSDLDRIQVDSKV